MYFPSILIPDPSHHFNVCKNEERHAKNLFRYAFLSEANLVSNLVSNRELLHKICSREFCAKLRVLGRETWLTYLGNWISILKSANVNCSFLTIIAVSKKLVGCLRLEKVLLLLKCYIRTNYLNKYTINLSSKVTLFFHLIFS